jgi:serine/threonine protein kinase
MFLLISLAFAMSFPYALPGYSSGPFLKHSSKVFLCQSLTTNISYICKLEMVPPGDYHLPIEILVFNLIKTNPHQSIISMHELLSIGNINFARAYIVVMDYYAKRDGWINFYTFIRYDGLQTNTTTIHAILKKIVDGVLHLLNLGISHSDIKRNKSLILADNILINIQTLDIKIIDFDLALPYFFGVPCNRYVGTPHYFSPEIVNRIPYSLDKNLVWQLGCLLYGLFFQEKPFKNFDDIISLDIKLRIAINSHKREICKTDSEFLVKMLSKKERDRPSLIQVSNRFRSK